MMRHSPSLLGPFGRRLFLSLSLLSLVVVAAVGLMGYRQARAALRDAAMARLEEVARGRAALLDAWFEERLADLSQMAAVLERPLARGHADPTRLTELLRLHLGRQGAYRRAVIMGSDLQILAVAGEDHHRTCLAPELPEVRAALISDHPVMGAVGREAHGDPRLHIASPLALPGGERGVVLTVMTPAETIYPILADTTGLGLSGETYLVDADTLMLSPSRHMDHPPELTHKMPTEGVLACLSGESASRIYPGFIGGEVLGAYVWMPRQQWALMAEMQSAEAFAPLRGIARRSFGLALLALLAALLLSATLSRRLARPVERLARASGRVAAGDLTSTALPAGKDELGLLCGRFNDMVDSLRRSREELESQSRELMHAEKLAAIGRLAAGVVHEMRNPLSALKMNLSSLERRADLSATEREQLTIARGQGDRLERMLDELLEYSRPVTVRLAKVRARTVLERIGEQLKAEPGVREIALRVEDDLTFQSDEEILLRALVNLTANALQASEGGRGVEVSAARDREEAVLSVRDRGAGMSEQVLARLFDPFFTTRDDGTGLGMSNVRKFAEALGGEVRVASREGVGTTVEIRLPAPREAASKGNRR